MGKIFFLNHIKGTEGFSFLSKRLGAAVILFLFSMTANASQDFQSFLKACAWGTLGGAVAGTVSLAFENKPSDHLNNVARGASLGLYAGIFYGLSDQSSAGAGAGVGPSLDRNSDRLADLQTNQNFPIIAIQLPSNLSQPILAKAYFSF